MKKLLGFVIFLVLFCARPAESQQQSVIFVNGADPTCDGQAPCYTTIQDAVDAAQSGNVTSSKNGGKLKIASRECSPGPGSNALFQRFSETRSTTTGAK